MSKKSATVKQTGKGLVLGIAASRFNPSLVDELLRHTTAELKALGVAANHIHIERVPGALELPIALELMASCGRFDALIALGCVIRGKTFHFEIVSTQSAQGIVMVQLKHHLPIANAVLTTESVKQAKSRCAIKGREAAQVAVEMARLKLQLVSSLIRPPRTKKLRLDSALTQPNNLPPTSSSTPSSRTKDLPLTSSLSRPSRIKKLHLDSSRALPWRPKKSRLASSLLRQPRAQKLPPTSSLNPSSPKNLPPTSSSTPSSRPKQ